MKFINNDNIIRVYKNEIAIELFDKGYKLLKLEVNTKQPQKTVFCFEYEKGLVPLINELKEKYFR